MKKAALIVLALTGVFSFALLANSNVHDATAHQTKKFGNINIEVGWADEPSIAGQINTVTVGITTASDDKPVANAIDQLQATIKKGGDTKILDLLPQEKEGLYGAKIIPSQIGQYEVVLKGSVSGQGIDGSIPLDNVEDPRQFRFPPGGSSTDPIPSNLIEQFTTAIADLTTQVDDAKTAADQALKAAQSAQDIKASADQAYMFGMIGVGVGVAGIALGVYALSRKEKVEGEKVPKF